MNIRLYEDSRDKHSYQRFGSAILPELPQDINFDDPLIPEKIQPIGDVRCGDYSVTYVAQNKTKVEYDMDELWSRVPHSVFGVVPNDIFSEVIKRGLTIKATGQRVYPFKSYYRADTDPLYDKFDSTRSAQIQTNSPVIIYSNWYKNWLNLGTNAIMPIGANPISGHMYVGKGWFNGENFIIEWWGGYTTSMPRATFNAAVSAIGCGAVVFSDVDLDLIRKRNLIEYIIDLCKNAVLLLKQQLQMQETPVEPQNINVPPLVHPSIQDWAKAIQQAEGWGADSISFKHNNPGNLGYTTLTASWGGQKGSPKTDGGYFCRFPDYDTGFTALCNFLTLGAENSLRAFHEARTLGQFSSVYGNTGLGYGMQIAKILGVPISTLVSSFLP